ncbi:hypothetical protein IMZ48_10345 [Candidatus Bathyarchaeota archaeon]|nr:hypothetical protein [Candidatus Bathyarchaeota archaeon]
MVDEPDDTPDDPKEAALEALLIAKQEALIPAQFEGLIDEEIKAEGHWEQQHGERERELEQERQVIEGDVIVCG